MTSPNVSTEFNELTATYHIWASAPGVDPRPVGSIVRGHQITAEHMLQYIDGYREAVSPTEWAVYESLMRTKQYGGSDEVESLAFGFAEPHPVSYFGNVPTEPRP